MREKLIKKNKEKVNKILMGAKKDFGAYKREEGFGALGLWGFGLNFVRLKQYFIEY